jgi:hypothetical protein
MPKHVNILTEPEATWSACVWSLSNQPGRRAPASK